MLNIFFGHREDTIYSVDVFFNHEREDHWLDNEMVKEMILDIDKTKVLGNNIVESPIFGMMPPEKLSGGVKALILMLFEPEYVYFGSCCGDNCAKWILKIADMHDLFLDFGHTMRFPQPFKIKILNSGEVTTSMSDLIDAHIKYGYCDE